MKANYTFREMTRKEELLSCFLFRYKIYSESELKIFLKENTFKINIDCFDCHSKHYALLYDDSIIGYMRVILPKDDYTNQDVIEIGTMYNLLNKRKNAYANMESPFQLLSSKSSGKKHWQLISDPLNRNESSAGSSRFMLHPEHRTVSALKFLCECEVALHLLLCIAYKQGITCVRRQQAPFYEYYELNNYTQNSSKSYENEDSEPNNVHKNIEDIAEELRMNGRIEKEVEAQILSYAA